MVWAIEGATRAARHFSAEQSLHAYLRQALVIACAKSMMASPTPCLRGAMNGILGFDGPERRAVRCRRFTWPPSRRSTSPFLSSCSRVVHWLDGGSGALQHDGAPDQVHRDEIEGFLAPLR